MNLDPDKTLQINALGEILLGDEPLGDPVAGAELLSSLKMEGQVCKAQYFGEQIFVESYTFPLVVQDIEKIGAKLLLSFNYGVNEEVPLSHQFFLDDWSKICSFNSKLVPLVFSQKAQDVFYSEVAQSNSYETYVIDGKEYEFEDWYVENKDTLNQKMWSGRYQEDDTPWDLSTYHPCLDWTLPRLKLSRSKILVPGCGAGHDAAKLSALSHRVTGLDFSEEAVKLASERYKDVPFLHSDVFSHAKTHTEHYDIVFEHTLFCAIDTGARSKLVKAWADLLKEGGHVLGTFIVCNKRKGPPFGVSEWELEELLSPFFKFEYWGRLRGKESARPGKELFVYARKK
jgi:SAM-dependent methyltransferase